MTAIQWTTAIRDIVCYQAFGKAYTDLRTDEKAYLDATNTPTAPTSSPGGIAGVSLGFCRQYAQWFEELGTSTSAVPTTVSIKNGGGIRDSVGTVDSTTGVRGPPAA